MNNASQQHQTRIGRRRWMGLLLALLLVGTATMLPAQQAKAQGNDIPPAGTVIGNQASATYMDNGGVERTVQSNTVQTTIANVPNPTITPGTSKQASPNAQVSFPHTLTNDGNGPDTYDLAAINQNGVNGDIQFFPDNDGDGQPDPGAPPITSTPQLSAGQLFNFVAVTNAPNTAGNTTTFDVQATSNVNDAVKAITDSPNSVTASNGPIVNVTKILSKTSGNGTGETITVRLRVTNQGNQNATNIILEDVLNQAFTQTGTASFGAQTGLTPNNDDDNFTVENRTVTYDSFDLPTSSSRTLEFQVTVDAEPNTNVPNTATYTYNDGNGGTITGTSNTTNYRVGGQNDVAITGEIIATAAQGQTIRFTNTVTNNGNQSDRYNIEIVNNELAGYPITLYNSDGDGNPTNPLIDSNGDNIPDVGPIAANESKQVIAVVEVPSGAETYDSNAEKSFTKRATSINDPNITDDAADVLQAVTAAQVDLANASGGDSGDNAGVKTPAQANSAGPVTTQSVVAGGSTDFNLYIRNTNANPSNYNLTAGSFSEQQFKAGTLPTGVSVQFLDPDDGNAVISTTGSIAGMSEKKVIARVSVAKGTSSGLKNIMFRAQGVNNSDIVDYKLDAVNVNVNRNLSLQPSRTGQVPAGASIRYTHVLTNAGNTAENENTNSSLELVLSDNQPNWVSTAFIDENNNGVFDDGTDTPLNFTVKDGKRTAALQGGALNPGATRTIVVEVSSPASVSNGTVNTTILTVQDDGTGTSIDGVGTGELTDSVTDVTTANVGNLKISKEQSTDGDTYKIEPIVNALPGSIIYYRIIVQNQGSASVSDIELRDTTPAFTGLIQTDGNDDFFNISSTGSATPTVNTPSSPADGYQGSILISAESLASGESFTVTFAVKINGASE